MGIITKKWWIGLGLLLITLYVWPSSPTLAVLSSCSASSSPNQATPGSTTDINFSLQNTDNSVPIFWIQVTAPSDDFSISNVTVSDWAYSFNSNQVTFTENNLAPGSTFDFTLSTTASNNTTLGDSWAVAASDDPSGTNATACTGSHDLNIVTPPVISNIQISSITTSSVTITWDTNSPTEGNIDYGMDSNYGSNTPLSSSFTTSHQQTINRLSANTGYHFMIYGQDQFNNSTTSSDNTFLTATPSGSNNGITQPFPSINTHLAAVSKKAPNSKTAPPQILLTTSLKGAYTSVPTFSGTATDISAITKVDYSTDGGQNWLPVDLLTAAGKPVTAFSFTPLLPQDGNYIIRARATDSSGNTSTTASQTLILDRTLPLIGGNFISVGPQILQPRSDGTILAQVGSNEKITLSTVGAPASVTISATTPENTKSGPADYTQTFNLTPSVDSGLWSGVMGFTKPGIYSLTASALNGAGAKSSRVLGNFYVAKSSQTLNKTTNKPITCTVTVYYFELASQTWEVWDGNAYNQQNPLKTNKTGDFSLFLPAGKYYLQASSPEYSKLTSNIFTLTQPSPLVTVLKLVPLHGLHIGSDYLLLPSLSIQNINSTNVASKNINQSDLVGKPAPDFSLSDSSGATITPTVLLGRPTLLSFNSIWAPTTDEELPTLAKLQSNSAFNIIPVALQENSGLAQAYTSIAGLNLNWLPDPNGSLSSSYNVLSLPTNYFIDRNGIIRHVSVGVLSQQQIINSLSGL